MSAKTVITESAVMWALRKLNGDICIWRELIVQPGLIYNNLSAEVIIVHKIVSKRRVQKRYIYLCIHSVAHIKKHGIGVRINVLGLSSEICETHGV